MTRRTRVYAIQERTQAHTQMCGSDFLYNNATTSLANLNSHRRMPVLYNILEISYSLIMSTHVIALVKHYV